MVPSPAELSYFLEVAATKNISRASERLGISQPSLSMAIKRLEEHMGTALLIRQTSGVRLTKAGERFQAKAQILLEQWQTTLKHMKREESEITGCYSLGAHVSVAQGRLSRTLAALLAQYPALEFKLKHDLSRRITEQVINFSLDFGVVVNPIEHPDLVIRRLYSDNVRFYVHADYHETHLTLSHLCYDPDLLQSRILLKQARQVGLNFDRYLASSSLEIIATMCAQGVGVAILPDSVAKRHGNLKPLWNMEPVLDMHMLIYRADMQCSVAARALAKALENQLTKQG
jgi:LysR family transcriptional regulator, cell division regulator